MAIACSFRYCVLQQAALCVFANLDQKRLKVEKSKIVQRNKELSIKQDVIF